MRTIEGPEVREKDRKIGHLKMYTEKFRVEQDASSEINDQSVLEEKKIKKSSKKTRRSTTFVPDEGVKGDKTASTKSGDYKKRNSSAGGSRADRQRIGRPKRRTACGAFQGISRRGP